MLPAKVDLTAYRGDSWSQTFRFLEADEPIDLDGATVESWAARNGTSHVLTVTTDAETGEITIGWPEAGVLEAGRYTYDVEVDKAGAVTTWVRGQLEVDQDVTNA